MAGVQQSIQEMKLCSSSSHRDMPVIGMGTAAIPFDASAAKQAVLEGIKLGYRHFDTASLYGSEKTLGEALAEAVSLGLVVSREEFFVTSKLWLSDSHPDLVLPALKQSLRNLQLEYLDLYLVHWPLSAKPGDIKIPIPKEDLMPMDFKAVWGAMEESQTLGLTKSIGVSNFSCKKLENILSFATIPPSVNQVEMNPVWQQKKLVEFCKAKNIIVTAYSPLGAYGTKWGSNRVMENQTLQEIAKAHGKSIAQVCLKWSFEKGATFLVKSFNKERMKQNLEIFDWELTEEDHEKISAIPQHKCNLGFISPNGPYKTLDELWDEETRAIEDPLPRSTNSLSSTTFTTGAEDIPPISGVKDFFRESYYEAKKLWFLAGPAIFTAICQYSLGAIAQVFAGQVSTIAIAAVSVQNSVIAGFSFGLMLGMGSALETLCGQAYGAGQLDMLGVYLQRSWVILNTTAIFLSLTYIFAWPLLKLIGQTTAISKAAGIFAIWMLPQLFAYAVNFPMAKFLQSQSKIMAMAVISGVALVMHTVFSWLLILKLGWGLAGAAVVLNASWILIDVAQFYYMVSGTCGQAWSGFSRKAFQNLWGFVKLSLASAVMICLDVWYYMALILFAGYLKNAQLSVDALSICLNIFGWTVMIALGMNAAISVRVSNELGAGHPRAAKLSLVVAVVSSFLIGLVCSTILLIFQNEYPRFFSNNKDVQDLVKELTPLLALCVTINIVQPVLSGVAVGAGWQAVVAYVNIGSYYIFGIPLGLILGYKVDLGVKGIWYGMLSGTMLQTIILFIMVYKTNWSKEASIAEDRIKQWGGGEQGSDIRDIVDEKGKIN